MTKRIRRFLAALAATISFAVPALAADLPTKAATTSTAPVGYPYGSAGWYYGLDTAAVTGATTQGEVGALVGYSFPIGTSAFGFVEADFNFANLNSTQNGVNLTGPASFMQRVGFGSPLSLMLATIGFPSFNLQVPTLPVLPTGVTVSAAHPYMAVALHEQDISASAGVANWHAWEISPGAQVGMLYQLNNGVALDLYGEAQFMNQAFCAPSNAGGCNNVGTLYRLGAAIKF